MGRKARKEGRKKGPAFWRSRCHPRSSHAYVSHHNQLIIKKLDDHNRGCPPDHHLAFSPSFSHTTSPRLQPCA